MSTNVDGHRYRPYGAIELKMTYQRNMLIANGMVLAMIASTLITAWILSAGNDLVVIPAQPLIPRDSIRVVLTDASRLHIIGGGALPTPRTNEQQGWNLAPVQDSMILDDSEWNDVRGVGLEGDTSGTREPDLGENAPVMGGTEPADAFPDYGVFIRREIEPVMISEGKPEYPAAARRLGLEGKAIIAALVDSNGRVRESKIVRSSGSDYLDSAAVRSAYQNMFSPAIQSGRPIAVWVTYRVEFKLDE